MIKNHQRMSSSKTEFLIVSQIPSNSAPKKIKQHIFFQSFLSKFP